MLQPSLTTKRLRLEPPDDQHVRHEVALDSDPDVMRFVGDGLPRSAEEVASSHARRMSRAGSGLGFWAGFTERTFVGWWLLTEAEDDHRGGAKLGYRLHKRFWRQGLAFEGAAALLEYGFDVRGLGQIFAETITVHVGSRSVMRRIGMQHIGTRSLEDDVAIVRSDQGAVDYAITADRWRRSVR